MNMYAEWPSIEKDVLDVEKCRSVLHTYPPNVGREVAKAVVQSLNPNSPSGLISQNATLPKLFTDTQVEWTMEAVCFGLSLTLSEIDTLKLCVQLYLDWLSAISSVKPSVPAPIRQNPLPYIRKIICHLENLFIPRSEVSSQTQIALCQTVLKSIHSQVHDSSILDRETWEIILMFVLKVSDVILSPPSQPNSFAEQLCDQLMQTLFNIWLLACARCFPTPSLWKTAQQLLAGWRHHPPVVDYWSRVSSALTSRMLLFMYGPNFPPYKVPDEDLKFIPKEMNKEVISQSFFRILHLIGDPVQLSNTQYITKTPKFVEYQMKGDSFFDMNQHPCLRMLPYIFLKAMRGTSAIVDAFLGLSNQRKYEVTYPYTLMQISTPITPTNARKSGKAKKGASSSVLPRPPASPGPPAPSPSSSTSSITPPSASSSAPLAYAETRLRPVIDRPQCNSILHMFGGWLFDAALAGCKFETLNPKDKSESRARSTSIPFSTSNTMLNVATSSENLVSNPMFDGSEFPESSDAGRAESCATLCRIMSCKKAGEHILPIYLSRFYLVLSQGLLGESKQVLASILLNSVDLMRIDLPGITCLMPALLSALETILPDKELQHFKPYLNVAELRRAGTHLLVSMLPLSLHYATQQVEDLKETWAGAPGGSPKVSFQQMKKQLLDLVIGTLQCESDPINTQMILGALHIAIHDSALFEAAGDAVAMTEGKKQAGVVQPSENENVPVDTAYGLFVQIIHLIAQKLDSWKSDITISLAALELLSGLAQAPVNLQDRNDCRKAVHELCQYIVHQCERPPPQHKRELHSMIVAAFQTLTCWLLEHPYLMDTKDCLYEVLEIIELGISGSKSKSSSTSVMKSDKELNPVSMRVMEAAESLLILVFEHMGCFPSPCSPSTTCSLLDECSLLEHIQGRDDADEIQMSVAVQSFRYFALHNGLLLGILEQNLQNEQEPVPTVTILIRGPSGKKVWTMQLRQTPRNDPLSAKDYLVRCDRPKPAEKKNPFNHPIYRIFPEEVDRIPLVKADCSIPLLTDVPNEQQAAQVEVLKKLIEEQKAYDEQISRECEKNQESMNECLPAHPTNEFHSARLFLSHLNLLTLESVKAQPQARLGPDLSMLNSSDFTFSTDLENIDSTPTRNQDTVYIFYLKAGQTEMHELLDNASGSTGPVQAAFTEFLLSLGWPVDVRRHPGWCGRHRGVWKLRHKEEKNDFPDLNKDPVSTFNGEPFFLYYADAVTEVAFIVPGPSVADPADLHQTDGARDRVKTDLKLDLSHTPPVTVTQESPTSPTGAVPSKRKTSSVARSNFHLFPDPRLAVLWCESYDSFDNFSYEKLESEMNFDPAISNLNSKEIVVILICPLKSGLFRILVHGQNVAKGFAIPLVSGMVVSRRSLGAMVRLTAMNICRRRRLSSDAYSPPHVRRKQRINELFNKYQRRCTEPDFFTAVFTDCKNDKAVANQSTPSYSSVAAVR